MSTLGTITASCVHCTWRTDIEGDALVEARDVHELMHPGGTVLVGSEQNVRGAGVITPPAKPRASVPWKPSTNGSERRPRGYWTRSRVIEAIQDFHSEHGRVPADRDLRAPMPTNPSIRRAGFASMNAAIVAAGFETRVGGRASGSAPSSEGPKREPVPPPAAKPEPAGRQVVDKNEGDSATALVDLAQVVDTLSTRRRAMLAELDALEAELREAVGALDAALAEHRLQEAA